ncbi:MAG: HNH endonuclease [Anaerolineae bacterium]|nr:HNH endonuclease [Anaerolineae bacterium]
MPRRSPCPCRHPGCPELNCTKQHATWPRPVGSTRPSASGRGYGRRWQRLRLMVLRRDPICRVDGCDKASTDVDHIVPRRDGGPDTMENLQGLCHSHHSKKTGRGQ